MLHRTSEKHCRWKQGLHFFLPLFFLPDTPPIIMEQRTVVEDTFVQPQQLAIYPPFIPAIENGRPGPQF